MKTNNKKLIVGALALVAGAGLVGSVSGSFAWFQYSTRTTAAFIGTAAHCSENMEIKVGDAGAWQKDYTTSDLATAIASNTHNGSKLAPLTTGAQTASAAMGTLYKNPIYQYEAMTSWGTADDANYVQFAVSLRVLDVDGANSATYLDKDVYLTNLTIRDVSVGADLSNAVRVHVASASTKALFANVTSTNTYGKLDLNNDGVLDKKTGYEWDSPADCVYGTDSSQQLSLNAASDTTIIANDTNATLTGGTSFGKTGTTAAGLTLTVTIWLEGWQKLSDPEDDNAEAAAASSAIWDSSTYIGKQFQVGMRFAVQPHQSAE